MKSQKALEHIAIINATQMNRKGGGILWNGKAVYWNIRKILQTPF